MLTVKNVRKGKLMNKKLLQLLLVMMLTLAAMPLFSSSLLADEPAENDDTLLNENTGDPADETPLTMTADPSAKYDPRPDGVSRIRDQYWGTCWAQAGISTAESYLITKGIEDKDYQLSVEDVLWWARNEDNGGWMMFDREASGFPASICGFLTTAGLRLESDIPYLGEPSDGDKEGSSRYGTGENQLPEKYYTAPVQYEITGMIYKQKLTIEEAKEWIRQYGAIGASYLAMEENFNPEKSASYEPYSELDGPNHAISIIGWDDSFPKENFWERKGMKPEHDGAWIIKNSFGKDYGSDGGFIYISYEDGFLLNEFGDLNFVYAITDMRRPLEQKRYFYDQYGAIRSITRSDSDRSVWANVFDFGKGEKINELSFVSWSQGKDYRLYYAPAVNDVPESDENKWILLAQGTIPYQGYITVPSAYDDGVPEGKGAIILSISGDSQNIGTDEPGYADNGRYKFNPVSDLGTGFELKDGIFVPVTVERSVNGYSYIEKPDLCIRAYTIPYSAIDPEDDEYHCTKGQDSSYQKGSAAGLTFAFDSSTTKEVFASRDGLKVDGNLLNDSQYSEHEGSWIVELLPSYLDSLSVGKHTLEALFKNYEGDPVTVSFTINEKKEEKQDDKKSSPASYMIPLTGIK